MAIKFFSSCLIVLACVNLSVSQSSTRIVSVAVLEMGESVFARRATEDIRTNLHSAGFMILDSDLVRAAAAGVGYSPSLNMSTTEARELGAAISCDFFIIGDAQTLRRTSSRIPTYFEAYCSIFIINARTGQLVYWERPHFEDAAGANAEQLLLQELATNGSRDRWFKAIRTGEAQEFARLSINNEADLPILEAPEDEKLAAEQGIQLPRPYSRLKPNYPETAAQADAEATVDVVVDVGADGEVRQVQIARWAGFGLDEAAITTVRSMHFFPAKRGGVPIPMRVLLRYNFRKSPRPPQ